MEAMASDEVSQLVKGMSDSFAPTCKEVMDDFKLPALDTISYDKTLAELLDMGYDIESARKAIQDSGCLDVATIIDNMNSGDQNLMPPTLDAPSMVLKVEKGERYVSTTRPPQEVEVRAGKGEQDAPGDETRPRSAQRSICEASTSRGKASPECRNPVGRGKAILSTSVEDSEDARMWEDDDDSGIDKESSLTRMDSEDAVDFGRWELDDDEGNDKVSSLSRMGFSEMEVTDALEACGEHSSVNDLANHIIMKLPATDDGSEDCYPQGEEIVEEETSFRTSRKGIREGCFEDEVWSCEDLSGEELTDQALPVFKKLKSMGCSFSLKMVASAVLACGQDATEDVLVNFLFGSDEQKLAGVGTLDESGELQILSKLQQLEGLGYSTAACRRAIDNNGDAEIFELTDYLEAEKINDELLGKDDDESGDEVAPKVIPIKRQKTGSTSRRFPRRIEQQALKEQRTSPAIYRNLKGFGLPGESVTPRELSKDVSGPPFFYFENVANTPKDEWLDIQRHLYNIRPEFVDSLNFSPCRRPRGYIHNLPVEGRQDILPKPPMSIKDLVPGSARFWPKWDPRIKLNTINTRTATEFVRRQIKDSMKAYENGEPSEQDIKIILFWARKWNLVWISPSVLAPLSPEDVEICLGFDPNHTRVLYSPVDRVRVLGNSFQVNTVAYHLSVLRPMYAHGIRVLSLFSGIGGAEVALHKLGIPLKLVVSVEIDDKARMVVDNWWKVTNQKGILIHSFHDVKQLDTGTIQKLIEKYGGIDLVIGGSPCNNLSGNNRCSRVGLSGPASITFFEFPRILAEVRKCMFPRGN